MSHQDSTGPGHGEASAAKLAIIDAFLEASYALDCGWQGWVDGLARAAVRWPGAVVAAAHLVTSGEAFTCVTRSLAISSVWGRAYISTRPVKAGEGKRRMDTPTRPPRSPT